jgi:hypothetical protein
LELIGLLPQTDPEEPAAEQPMPQPEPEPAVEPEQPAEPVEEAVQQEAEEEAVKVFGDMPEPQPAVQVIPPSDNTHTFTAPADVQEEVPAHKNRFADIRFGDEYDMEDEPEEERKGFFKRKK